MSLTNHFPINIANLKYREREGEEFIVEFINNLTMNLFPNMELPCEKEEPHLEVAEVSIFGNRNDRFSPLQITENKKSRWLNDPF